MGFLTRLKKLTDYLYSPTNPASEDAIRGQVDDSVQEVYDNTQSALASTTLGDDGSSLIGHNSTSITASTVNAALEENRLAIDTSESDLTTLEGRVTVNEGDIDTAEANIATNTSNISTNAGNIATNTANITSNDGDITALQGRVTVNEGDVSTNTANIATNASDISTLDANKADDSEVLHNTGNETVAGVKTFSSSPIVPLTPTVNEQTASKGYVDTELAGAVLGSLPDNSVEEIKQHPTVKTGQLADLNTSDKTTLVAALNEVDSNTDSNTSGIVTNTNDISTNAANIATNTGNIATNTSDISTNAGNISTNTSNISTNTTNISDNTTDIGTNTTNIGTNTTNISTNTTDIGTNETNLDINRISKLAGGTANAATVNTTGTFDLTLDGNILTFTPNFNNTGAFTVNPDSQGDKTVEKYVDGSYTALVADDIKKLQHVSLVWNTTRTAFQLAPKGGSSATVESYQLVSGEISTGTSSKTVTISTIDPDVSLVKVHYYHGSSSTPSAGAAAYAAVAITGITSTSVTVRRKLSNGSTKISFQITVQEYNNVKSKQLVATTGVTPTDGQAQYSVSSATNDNCLTEVTGIIQKTSASNYVQINGYMEGDTTLRFMGSGAGS